MKTSLKILAVILLLLNGVGAIYGGLNLIVYPNGSSLQLPLEFLHHSPFNNYFIPGLILFASNGLFSLFACVALFSHLKKYALYIFIQGCILTGCIIIQVIMLQLISYYHVVCGISGLLLMLCGWKLNFFSHNKIAKNRIKLA